MKGLFISEAFIKENTPINDNVDDKLLKMAIIEAQELHLLEAIGTGLYNDLNAKIVAGTIAGMDLTLMVDYIRPMMKYWVMYEGTPMLLFKFTNKSNSTSTSDNSAPVQYEDMKYSVNQFKAKAQVYTARLARYIEANATSFPLYYNAGHNIDTIFPTREGYTTDWYLGDMKYVPPQSNMGDIR
ncbi:hypothetical protein UFOVP212_21 [uncultured Caudovirales phage]|uniref:Uncharacterized protein n=1 Tax=uncultured Caudovirales phage TaxID=2100421 RepID=A0A6J7WK12_9CAUD|nr:hypothetical protein UFOVP212_21 [uncultured Caudovirales phage]